MMPTGEPPADPATTEGGQHDAWLAVLDELEREAAKAAHPSSTRTADAGPREAGTPWSPPAGIGPLPADLADRAARLLSTQLQAESLLQEERTRVGRHLMTVRAVDPARPAADSVYLDVLG